MSGLLNKLPQNKPPKILAVDDNQEALFSLRELLVQHGYEVITAQSGRETLQLVRRESPPDIILLDVKMPEPDGYEVTRILKSDPILKYLPITLLTSMDSQEDVVAGLEAGADDYIKKPYKTEELLARVKCALRIRENYCALRESLERNVTLEKRLSERFNFGNIIGQSTKMQEIFSLIERIGDAEVPILITGDSGTGKELVATAIHVNSPRGSSAFVIQNCSAFNENLLESELFGHVKGAFTGAIRDKQGLFEVADGGTFFLDELGEMSPALQVKLLRVLQDGTFTPVGGTKQKKVNVRIVAATNRNLQQMVKEGSFREDLYYRLNVVNIHLPRLSERRVDIPLLAEFFLKDIAERRGKARKELSEEVLACLADYSWPGNIRELQNEIERLIIMSGDAELIDLEFLSAHIRQSAQRELGSNEAQGKLRDALETLEREIILSTLERLGGNKSEAARELGISRSNLITKVAGYGLEK